MIRYFACHPSASNLIMVLVVAAGLLALPTLKRTTFPEYALDEVGITVIYRGAPAEEVEKAICRRIGDAVEGLTDLGELRCAAREGRASAVAELIEGGNFTRFMDDIKTQVDAIEEFPEEAEEPVIEQLERTDFVAEVVLSGPMSASHLERYAEAVKERLQRLPQVSQVRLHGFSDTQYHVEVPKATLQRLGLSARQLAGIIASQGVDLPVGVIETPEQHVLVRFQDERRTPAELEDLVVVAAPSGAELTLGDIATVTPGFEEDEQRIEVDGERAAILEVRKTAAEDTLRVIAAVREYLDAERARAPPTVTLEISQNISVVVENRLTMLVENGLMGLVLVFLAMWLFFRAGIAFWVVVGLPVSFLGTFFVMTFLDYSINMITMVSLLMAIGLLMDDAIVLAENVAARREGGDGPVDAVVGGIGEVAPGVVSSFLTTLAVFGPMAFLSGQIGRVMAALPVVLIITLAISFIEAFIILPHHLVGPVGRLGSRGPGRLRARFEDAFETLRERGLGRLADAAVRHRYGFMGVLLATAVVTVGAFAGGMIRFQALPEIEGDVVAAYLLMPQGTPLARTEAIAGRIVAGLDEADRALRDGNPGGARLVERVHVRYGDNRIAHESGAHVATILADLLPSDRRRVDLDVLYDHWREAIGPIADVVSLTLQEPRFGPEGWPIEIRLIGEDLATLKEASLELQKYLAGFAGARELLDDLRPGKPERRLKLREGAHSLGLDAGLVAGQLAGAWLGGVAQELQVGDQAIEVEVRHAAADRSGLEALETFMVRLPDGGEVPLPGVAEIEPGRGWARINRIDDRRTVTIYGDVDVRVANTIDLIDRTRAEFLPRLQERYPGIEVAIEGQSQEASQTSRSIRTGFLVGLLGVFLVLAFQFRSYLEPLVVMLVIPFALLGAFWGHAIVGYDISMPSLVGAVSLAGIVVNDSILLVRFLKLRVAEGREVTEAARLASRDRFRAVLLTSLTTILGLLPLMAETSVQAQVLKPLVLSVVAGLVASTFLVLLVVPALYAILHDLGLARPAAAQTGPDGAVA